MDCIQIRECTTITEFDSCIRLQREVFGLPELEISPRRHLIVSRQAGGWTLGAFVAERLVGFVHHMTAAHGSEIFGYSHMMAVTQEYQNKGVGARLKWSQRERALNEGRSFIKWTWDPMQARNAYFNLNRLGVVVRSYAANFYGTDYLTSTLPDGVPPPGIDSDRLFAEWHLQSARVMKLAEGAASLVDKSVAQTIQIPADWTGLCKQDLRTARQEQLRVRSEFQNAFAGGLVCAGFERSTDQPRYLLYERAELCE
ncbi:MAG: GNAT family N-acetyltransferase [Pyrinomonadaceae bacterium]